MLRIHTPVITEKGALKPNVRKDIRDTITDVSLGFSNGSTESLKYMGNGDYYGLIATCDDGTQIFAKINLVITINDYKEPVKKIAKPREKEATIIE